MPFMDSQNERCPVEFVQVIGQQSHAVHTYQIGGRPMGIDDENCAICRHVYNFGNRTSCRSVFGHDCPLNLVSALSMESNLF